MDPTFEVVGTDVSEQKLLDLTGLTSLELVKNILKTHNIAKIKNGLTLVPKRTPTTSAFEEIITTIYTNGFLGMLIGMGIGSLRCTWEKNTNINTLFRTVAISTFTGMFWQLVLPISGAYYTYKALKSS